MYYPHEINRKPEEIIEYLRKSRSDDPLLTVEEVLARHETILDDWARQRLGAPVPECNKYREIVSGETIEDRPQIKEVLRLIESPRYSAILVVEVQRLSRGDLEDAGRLIKLLRYTNTMVITPQKTYDLQDEYDRDAFERELKRGNEYLEYQKKIMGRGRVLSVQQGNFIGSIPPYGYDRTVITEGKQKIHTLAINQAEADVVRMVFDLYVNQDMARVSIARRLNDLGIKPRKAAFWEQSAIKGILENEHYIGKVRWNRRKTNTVVNDGEICKTRPLAREEYMLFDGRHEPIISKELFQQAAAKQGRNHRAKLGTKIRNPFAGLLFCHCGRAMALRTYIKNGKERSAPRMLCDNQVYCKTSSCLYEEVVDRVRLILQENIHDFEVQAKKAGKDARTLHERQIQRLKAKQEAIFKREISYWEDHANPDPEKRMPNEVFEKLREKTAREKEEVAQALRKAYETIPEDAKDYEEKRNRFREALIALDDPKVPAEKKNRLLKKCIERIEYSRGPSKRITRKNAEKGVKLTPGGHWDSEEIVLTVKLLFQSPS